MKVQNVQLQECKRLHREITEKLHPFASRATPFTRKGVALKRQNLSLEKQDDNH